MTTTNPLTAAGDELDDILSGIAAEGGYSPSQPGPANSRTAAITDNGGAGLGIDEEIVVTKKRIPIPKLDDVRLRSEPGIPRLRKISKERLRFKGKGHEYGDIARMLNMYQLWLDDLYPRAKFADALAIIKKVGHTKRMQVDRKAWMDEGKPKHARDDSEKEDHDAHVPHEVPAQSEEEANGLQAADAPVAEHQSVSESSARLDIQTGLEPEEPDEDELDALLAESVPVEPSVPRVAPLQSNPAQDDLFADDMEAMEGMDDMW